MRACARVPARARHGACASTAPPWKPSFACPPAGQGRPGPGAAPSPWPWRRRWRLHAIGRRQALAWRGGRSDRRAAPLAPRSTSSPSPGRGPAGAPRRHPMFAGAAGRSRCGGQGAIRRVSCSCALDSRARAPRANRRQGVREPRTAVLGPGGHHPSRACQNSPVASPRRTAKGIPRDGARRQGAPGVEGAAGGQGAPGARG